MFWDWEPSLSTKFICISYIPYAHCTKLSKYEGDFVQYLHHSCTLHSGNDPLHEVRGGTFCLWYYGGPQMVWILKHISF